ncbi:MAG: phosphohistidine phosphatase SixA [Desulfuromonadales bacterium]
MRLYLMQHALAYSAEEDAERPLNPVGVKQAKQSASGIKRLGLVFDLIMTSPKRRAKQTAALVAEEVRYPYSDIMTTEALLPDRTPAELLELLQKESTDSRILIVGHLPHLALLADTLSGGDLVFENAGLTCLEMSGPKTARLTFHLQAGQLNM